MGRHREREREGGGKEGEKHMAGKHVSGLLGDFWSFFFFFYTTVVLVDAVAIN